MRATLTQLIGIAVTASLFAAPQAQAEHVRDLELTADRIQNQAVQFARYLRYQVPTCDASPRLQRAALDLYTGASELQECLLFFNGSQEEENIIRHKLRRLERRQCDAERELRGALAALPRPQPQYGYNYGRGRSGVRVSFGHGVQVQFGSRPQGRQVASGPEQRELSRLRNALQVLHGRLHAMESTIRRANRLVGRRNF